ncbi:MAG TPA: DNA-3-methyladenine glycosylase [Solirubrobacteraceae bacterium]|nr:DNA-3-methyladenine glycosylase [Solirubrobacteraceae bacterium]
MKSLPPDFYDRPVVEVARELIGCTLAHGATGGVIVEAEAYHDSEGASHGYRGQTPRTRTLFGPPGHAYVYRSYGIHAMLNAVCEREGVGAGVLIRALEPRSGVDLMSERRGVAERLLCAGPGRLCEALDVTLALDGAALQGPELAIGPRPGDWADPQIRSGPRIGITRATELPWRFAAAGNPFVSRPRL